MKTALNVFNESPDNSILNRFLKLSELSVESRRRSGKEFQEVKPATEKARRLNVLSRYRGRVRCGRLAKRSCRQPTTSELVFNSRPGTSELLQQAAMDSNVQLVQPNYSCSL